MKQEVLNPPFVPVLSAVSDNQQIETCGVPKFKNKQSGNTFRI
jgi:hypothetical protein